MTCPLCGNKPSWCECTPADYAAADMAKSVSSIDERLEAIEQRQEALGEVLGNLIQTVKALGEWVEQK